MPNVRNEIRSPAWIYAKGVLFLVTGLVAAALLWLELPTVKTAVLLAVAMGLAFFACIRCWMAA